MKRVQRKTFLQFPLAGAAVLALALPLAAAPAPVADVVTVGHAITSSTTVDIPVYIRDTSGTPLGLDQPPGSRIQSYGLTVNYAPASAVQSITFTRAGITQTLTPTAEFMPSSAGSVSLLDSFSESTDLIPFTLDGAPPGNQVAHLTVTLTSGLPTGTNISLTLDPTLTQLTDEGGDSSTKESVAGANLLLVNGNITFVDINSIPTLGPGMLLLLAAVLAVAGLRIRT